MLGALPSAAQKIITTTFVDWLELPGDAVIHRLETTP
jgi:hypothetical protein